METIKKILAENIRSARKAKRWTQTRLAVEAGISFRGLQDIEAEKNQPRKDTIEAIAGALGTTVTALYSASATTKTPATELTPETLRAIQDATKASVLAAIEESKGLPGKFETYKTERQQLDSLIDLLDDNQVKGLLEAVQKLIVNKKKARSIVG